MDDVLNLILQEVAGIKPVLSDLTQTMTRVEQTVQEVKIKNAEQDVHISNVKDDINRVGNKLRGHIDGHWGYVATVIGIVSIGLALMKFHVER